LEKGPRGSSEFLILQNGIRIGHKISFEIEHFGKPKSNLAGKRTGTSYAAREVIKEELRTVTK